MEKTKIWHKDHVSKFKKGDRVVVFRRKKNGHPKCLIDGKVYIVSDIIADDVMIKTDGPFNSQQVYKIHKTYLIDIQWIREELLKEILKDD